MFQRAVDLLVWISFISARWMTLILTHFTLTFFFLVCFRFKPRLQGSPSDNDVVCTGGDNSYGLIITEPDGEQQQISVNDSIIGRSSNPFIAKVGNLFNLNLEEIKQTSC